MDEERSVFTAEEDNWDDIDLSDVDGIDTVDTAEEEPEADQQTEEPKQEEEPSEQPKAEPEAKPETDHFKLKYLGEEKEVTREEVIQLAQKGSDYDRIRAKYDEAKPKLEQHDTYEKFLKELADAQGVDIPTLIDTVRARTLAKNENIDESVALERVRLGKRSEELDKREAKLAEQQKAEEEKQTAQSKRDKDISEFMTEYADVDIKSIPDEVWLEVSKGKGLADAYRRYENKKLKADIESLKQESKNKERSTGSKSTVGTEKADKWFDGWED